MIPGFPFRAIERIKPHHPFFYFMILPGGQQVGGSGCFAKPQAGLETLLVKWKAISF